MCEERIIKSVDIIGLEAPYLGKNPDYTAEVSGYGYSFESSEQNVKAIKVGHFTYTSTITVSNSGFTHNIDLKKIPEGVLLGDIDLNGKINSVDSNLLKRKIAGLE